MNFEINIGFVKFLRTTKTISVYDMIEQKKVLCFLTDFNKQYGKRGLFRIHSYIFPKTILIRFLSSMIVRFHGLRMIPSISFTCNAELKS